MKSRTHTHTGHCQLCDRSQAVNVKTGLIAKHGYAVEWSQFIGVCPGSDYLPYEVSTDRIPSAIESQTAQMERLAKQLREVKAFAKSDPYFGYATCSMRPANDRFGKSIESTRAGHYSDEAGKYSDGSPRNIVVFTPAKPFDMGPKLTAPATLRTNAERGVPGLDYYSHTTALEAATSWRNREHAQLAGTHTRHAKYREWLTERVASWKKRELTPVVAKVEAKRGVQFTYQGRVYTIVEENCRSNGYSSSYDWKCSCSTRDGSFNFSKAHVSKLLNPPAPKGAK